MQLNHSYNGCCNLNSVQSITMSVSPFPVQINVSGMLYARKPSSGLRFIFENTASMKTTHVTKIHCIVLSPIFNI